MTRTALDEDDDSATTGAVPPSPLLARLQHLLLAALLALVSLGLAWELWLAPTGARTLALKVVPLALALPGLLRHRLYTYRWLSLLVWVYVLEGLMRATTERGVPMMLAVVELALALVIFTVATVYIRQRLRNGSRHAAAR